jgi:DNA-binding MarR family transcriptional regulator
MFKDELISKLEEVALGMRKARTRVFDGKGFGAGQARVLSALFEYGKLSQADIGRIVDIAGPTVKKLVENLLEKGFIKVRASGKDRRINIVALTPKGKKLEPIVNECIEELSGIVTDGFSEPEIIMTGMLLARINENLKLADDADQRA